MQASDIKLTWRNSHTCSCHVFKVYTFVLHNPCTYHNILFIIWVHLP